MCSKICEILGEGSIQKKPKTSVCVLYINNYKGVINLVNLINGKLKTNKIDRLNLLIDWLNNAPLNEMISKINYYL